MPRAANPSTSTNLNPSAAKPRASLRVAVIQGGRILEEHGLCGAVTVGCGAGCTIILPEPRLSRSHRLVTLRKGRVCVNLAPFMSMKWACGGQITSEPATEHEHGGPRAFLLPLGARGRIVIGDQTLLFTQVNVQAQPRPQLPRSLRQSAWNKVDTAFAATLGLVLLLQGGLVAYLRSFEWPAPPQWEAQPDRIAHVIMHRPLPKLGPPKETQAPIRPTPATTKHAPAPSAQREVQRTSPPLDPQARRDDIAKRLAETGLVAILTAKRHEEGFVADLLQNGAVDRDQETAMRNVGSVQVATENTLPGLGTPAAGGVRVVIPSALRASGAIAIAQVGPTRGERHVESKVMPDPPITDRPGLAPGALAKQLRPYMSGVRACYERSLKNNVNLGGKLIIRLTLSGAGTVIGVEIDNQSIDDAALGACLKALALRWRFSPLPNGGAEVVFPLVFQAAN